jgi:hypothetical protein
MKDRMTPKAVAAVGALAIAVVALIGWVALVSPQRSKATDLDRQIADARTQLVVLNANARTGSTKKNVSALVLARAMPQRVAMPEVLRQLLRAANASDVRLDSVTPQPAAAGTGYYETVPMDVVVTGRYFPIQRFLHRLRTQTRVAGDRVHASGRLFRVDTVSLAAGDDQLPQLAATIHLNVFTYSGSAAAATPATTPEAAPDSSTSSSAVAAGGTP